MKNANTDLMTDIQRAARFYYLQHTAFGAKSSGQNFGTATTARPVNLLRIEEQLSEAHLRLSGVTVEHLGWDACLMKYDRAHSFMYADPPYWKLAGYGVDFGLDQLSINDHPDMREVFDGLNIDTVKINYTVGNSDASRSAKQELIITNY